jgi:hypothetical protein
MINLPSVTLVCLTSIQIPTAIAAIQHCCKHINFGDVKLITHEDIKSDKKYKVEKSPKFENLQIYSDYLLGHLSDHFETSHCLHIQMDGVVSNPYMWTDEFLNYDYIGAPWPNRLVLDILNKIYLGGDQNGNKFETSIPKLKDYNVQNYRVGNGGFSLRSKKLCDLTKNFVNKYPNKSEDCIICFYEKEFLIENNITYAPVELASQFSVEYPTEFNHNKDVSRTFGFHRY